LVPLRLRDEQVRKRAEGLEANDGALDRQRNLESAFIGRKIKVAVRPVIDRILDAANLERKIKRFFRSLARSPVGAAS